MSAWRPADPPVPAGNLPGCRPSQPAPLTPGLRVLPSPPGSPSSPQAGGRPGLGPLPPTQRRRAQAMSAAGLGMSRAGI